MSEHLERDPQLPKKLIPKLQVAGVPQVNSEKDKQMPFRSHRAGPPNGQGQREPASQRGQGMKASCSQSEDFHLGLVGEPGCIVGRRFLILSEMD